MNDVYQVKKERLKDLHGIANNIVSQFQFFSIRHCTNVNKMFVDLLRGEMPIHDSSIKYELIDELVLYGAMKIQYSSLKDELALRRSPSKFIDGHCNISWICVCCVLINAYFLMIMCFFNLYTKCAPTTPCKVQLGELHICNKW